MSAVKLFGSNLWERHLAAMIWARGRSYTTAYFVVPRNHSIR